MIKCLNEKCDKNPMDSLKAICVNEDGDFVCDENCKREYERQMKEFFDNIADDRWFYNWLTRGR